MLKVLIPAAIASLITVSPASAVTPASVAPQLKPLAVSDVVHTASDKRHDGSKHRGHSSGRHDGRKHRGHSSRWYYSPGRRYSHAPRGWRRYKSRPHYWRTRGCIIVGPVWFCP